ncbi:Protein translocase subunit SecE [Bathymodiolus thermophilus thioautotrophic gill symbiont]|uniref:Protein translocase subunit SecE n=1 Tax=Bathymodiolus thermophilus thioautotrophic gill symbiont TaxID=2360 RepID=A0A1J5UJF4_9GAMM|nr:preprotein translocase subunit SecE [Bathymodiolus thermophilus thioautotrophic gill symbiont]AYQ56192.1 Protein translocase subunit SecE [Bathymodiolus thermophilus thioautotrophic gill symbiont]OIR24399.1 preprotein translocase subunit SecE [Bathymodiolus thermophilus thioautotrophic gill symbiont]CAB5494764.1 Protein translocase subunit SecE [Bathymodiolus thermophilus thioautotrophic gill symbiont]CAB5495510.1 Protein translocase subunit SecE [Bathymodiolus thermophilus thioautotrophic g
MSKNTENQVKTESSIGSIISILIVIGSLVFFYLDPLALNTTLYKVLVLLAGLVVAGFVFLKSPQGIRLTVFSKETKIELRKVVWPTKDETLKTTGMIMVAVVIVAIFLWIVDAFFTWAVQLLTN